MLKIANIFNYDRYTEYRRHSTLGCSVFSIFKHGLHKVPVPNQFCENVVYSPIDRRKTVQLQFFIFYSLFDIWVQCSNPHLLIHHTNLRKNIFVMQKYSERNRGTLISTTDKMCKIFQSWNRMGLCDCGIMPQAISLLLPLGHFINSCQCHWPLHRLRILFYTTDNR